MAGNLASAAIGAISGMDALRIKCNKVERKEGRDNRLVWTDLADKRRGGVGVGGGCQSGHTQSSQTPSWKGKRQSVCFYSSVQTRSRVREFGIKEMDLIKLADVDPQIRVLLQDPDFSFSHFPRGNAQISGYVAFVLLNRGR